MGVHSSGSAHIRSRDRIVYRSHHFAESGVLQSSTHDLRQIVCGCIMVGVRKAACIGKMSSRTAQLFRLRVHHIDKLCFRTAYCLRDLGADLVGRLNNSRIPAVLHGDRLAQLHTDIAAVPGHITHSCFGKGNLRPRRRVFHRYQKRHQFRCTRRKTVLVHAFVIKDSSRIRVYQHGCLGHSSRRCRPVLNIIRRHCRRRSEIHSHRPHRHR